MLDAGSTCAWLHLHRFVATAHVVSDLHVVTRVTEAGTFHRKDDVTCVLLLQLLARHLVGVSSTVETLGAVRVVLALATAVERDEVLAEVELTFREEVFLLRCRVLALLTCGHVLSPLVYRYHLNYTPLSTY